MDLLASFRHRENKLISGLKEHQAAFDDPNGKGDSTERVVDEALIWPYLPPGFESGKGTVVERPDKQSAAIDRVIWSRNDGQPLVHSPGHSLFPTECVVGGVEITMALNGTKLRTDVSRLAELRAMRNITLGVPMEGTTTQVAITPAQRDVSYRAFIVGYPSSEAWNPTTIAETFFGLQKEFKTLVHGLYVLGIGYFRTMSPERGSGLPIRIKAYKGDDRLFTFTIQFRGSMDRWGAPRVTPHLEDYVPDSGEYLFPGNM